MKLTATPFDPATGELLPVYRDAYLRGDLARTSARAVEDYLRHDATQAHSTVTRWHELQTTENEEVATPSWVQRQLQFIREEPRRFRQRAAALVTVAALVAGASMASTMRPAASRPVMKLPVASLPTVSAPTTEAALARTVVLHGRVLNEKGQPLAGATVLRKGTPLGVSTDAAGNYSLRVPADGLATLQYGYGGYVEQELPATQAGAAATVTLQPKAATRHRRWLIF